MSIYDYPNQFNMTTELFEEGLHQKTHAHRFHKKELEKTMCIKILRPN